MKRFKHPVREIREPFGTAGLIVAIVALIAALAGGAYAASGGLSGTQKKEVEKIAKKYAGKPGANGAAGPAGPTGAAGAKGDAGAAGANGTAGTNGTNGANGISVTNTTVPTTSTSCNHQGGAEFKVGSGTATTACNGATGFTATLPSGETETGKWSAIGNAPPGESVPMAEISYSIPLAQPSENVVYLNKVETEGSPGNPVEGCEYELENPAAEPVAPPGTLCVFTFAKNAGVFKFVGETATNGDSKSGTYVWFEPLELEPGVGATVAWGTWAVTAK
jgi:hypothetical protein